MGGRFLAGLRHWQARIWGAHILSLIALTWLVVALVVIGTLKLLDRWVGIDTRALTLPEAMTGALATLTALGATAALVVNARRQDLAEKIETRESVTAFTTRFRESTSQLAGETQAERLAGVYGLTSLAEEYVDRAKQCADVLCGYLRIELLPATHTSDDVGDDPPSYVKVEGIEEALRPDIEVRSAILEELRRLTTPSATGVAPWSSLRIDLSRALLHDLDLSGCELAELVLERTELVGVSSLAESVIHKFRCRGAQFLGETTWSRATLGGYGHRAVIESTSFEEADFTRLHFPGGALFEYFEPGPMNDFSGLWSDGLVRFQYARFRSFEPSFAGANFNGGVTFDECEFEAPPSFQASSSEATEVLHSPQIEAARLPPEMNGPATNTED